MRKRKKRYKNRSWLGMAVLFLLAAGTGVGVFGEKGFFNNTQDTAKQEEFATDDLADGQGSTGEDPEDAQSYPEYTDGKMAVHFLDVGQGLAVFVQCDGKNLIYDGGDRRTSSEVVAYLENMGVETIDYLISSHYDADHVSGLIGCLNVFSVKHVICADYVHESKTYDSFINTVKEKGLEMEHPSVGTEYSFGSGYFTILAPEEFEEGESNENSVVIRLVHGENSFLLTGDAEHTSEEAMCHSGLELESTVLVPGHHGSATATSGDFLMQVVPEYAVISCGEGNSYGHPHEETMEKLEAMEVQVYRTDKQGYISVVSDGKSLDWSQEPCNDYSDGD